MGISRLRESLIVSVLAFMVLSGTLRAASTLIVPWVDEKNPAMSTICRLDNNESVVFHPSQWHGPDAFSADIKAAYYTKDQFVSLTFFFYVTVKNPVWPASLSEREIEQSDHCEIWFCDSESGAVLQMGFSPGNFSDVMPFVWRWIPSGRHVVSEDVSIMQSKITPNGYLLSVNFRNMDGEMLGWLDRLVNETSSIKMCLSVQHVGDKQERSLDCMLSSSGEYRWKRCETFNQVQLGANPTHGDIPSGLSVKHAKEALGLKPGVNLPPFSFWRRRDLSDGKSPFDRFTVNKSGNISRGVGSKEKLEHGFGDWKYLEEKEYGTPLFSPTNKWTTTITGIEVEDDGRSMRSFILHAIEKKGSRRLNVEVPPVGWGATPLVWHTNRDVYLYTGAGGPSNCRTMAINYIDLSNGVALYSIGGGGATMRISPDGRWLLWERKTGCRQDNMKGGPTQPNQLVMYDFETRTNYSVTEPGFECHFERWELSAFGRLKQYAKKVFR